MIKSMARARLLGLTEPLTRGALKRIHMKDMVLTIGKMGEFTKVNGAMET